MNWLRKYNNITQVCWKVKRIKPVGKVSTIPPKVPDSVPYYQYEIKQPLRKHPRRDGIRSTRLRDGRSSRSGEDLPLCDPRSHLWHSRAIRWGTSRVSQRTLKKPIDELAQNPLKITSKSAILTAWTKSIQPCSLTTLPSFQHFKGYNPLYQKLVLI